MRATPRCVRRWGHKAVQQHSSALAGGSRLQGAWWGPAAEAALDSMGAGGTLPGCVKRLPAGMPLLMNQQICWLCKQNAAHDCAVPLLTPAHPQIPRTLSNTSHYNPPMSEAEAQVGNVHGACMGTLTLGSFFARLQAVHCCHAPEEKRGLRC